MKQTSEQAPQVLATKRALVTGASSGMGRQIAVEMAAAGAEVVGVGRDEERLKETVREIVAASGTAHFIVRDLAKDDAPEAVVAEAAEQMGGIDILANVAGIAEGAPIEKIENESLERQWRINVRAPFVMTRASIPFLRRAKGTVIFVSSVAALAGMPEASAYSATKGAIEAFARQLAVELGPEGIRVNAIAPGEINTPMNTALYQDAAIVSEIVHRTPLRRIGESTDVAQVAVFLASDAAAYVSGVSLVVDGGVLAT